MRLDTEGEGLHALYKPYTAKILQFLWYQPAYEGNGMSNLDLHLWYNKYAQDHGMKKVSRASIINRTQELEDDGIIKSYEVSGKGGVYKKYYPALSPQMFMLEVRRRFGEKLEEMFRGPWWKP